MSEKLYKTIEKFDRIISRSSLKFQEGIEQDNLFLDLLLEFPK